MSKFKITRKIQLLDEKQLATKLSVLKFGKQFSEHMAHIKYQTHSDISESDLVTQKSGGKNSGNNGEWYGHEIVPFENISLSPAAAVFHYGQEVFEGIKAYRHQDSSVWAFRIELNAKRFNQSAERLGLPQLPEEDFIDSVHQLVKIDKRWVPSKEEESLYIRPFMIATEPFLGVRAAHNVDYYCILSPVGKYFDTSKPVSIWVESEYYRSGFGGTGAAKCGGNYAASLLPIQLAYERGKYSQVLFLNAQDKQSIEELGGMSFFVVYNDGSVATPELNGQILESITRRTIIELLENRGTKVVEEKLNIQEVVQGIQSNKITEAFACGTGAIITPIGQLTGTNFSVSLESNKIGKITKSLLDEITNIQFGLSPDKFNWLTRLAD